MTRTAPHPFFIYGPPERDGAPEHGCIILHATEAKWLAANGTTVHIARRLAEGLTVSQIAAGLSGRYGISQERADQDVRYVVDELAKRGFLNGGTALRIRQPVLENLYFHLTTRCNLACPHCYVASPGTEDLPVSLVIRAIDELAAAGGRGIALSGGEPLLHPDIRKILDYASSRVEVQILSNGTLIDENWAAFLANQVNPIIQISIDGATEEIHDRIRGRGTFIRALTAVELLQEAGLGERLRLAATITRHNLHDLPNLIDLAQARGIPQVRFLPLRPVGRAREQWAAIGGLTAEEYENFFDYALGWRSGRGPALKVSCGLSGFIVDTPGCGPGDDAWCPVGRSLVIDINGDAFPCVLMMREEFRLGNAFGDGLESMIQGKTMARTVKSLGERREKIEGCTACSWRNLCQAGCMGQALDEHGTVWEKDAFCGYRKKAYERAFDRILEDFSRQERR